MVDLEDLREIFKERFKSLKEATFDLGVYNTLTKSTHPHPAGLSQNAKLIEQLVDISNGEIRATQLQQVISEFPSCNDTTYKVSIWSMNKATSMATLLAHWRRLRYEPQRLQNCLAKATKAESKIVQKLSKLKPGLARGGGEPSQPAVTTKRKLKAEVSAVSLDSQGFPTMLKGVNTPSASSVHDSPAKPAEKATAVLPTLCPKKKRLDFQGLQQKLLEEAQDSCHQFPERHCAEAERRKKKLKATKQKNTLLQLAMQKQRQQPLQMACKKATHIRNQLANPQQVQKKALACNKAKHKALQVQVPLKRH